MPGQVSSGKVKSGPSTQLFQPFYQGPCEGDSGGPLYVNFGTTPERKLQTLEGIVSGGIACGKSTPSWYTRVST